MTLTLFLFLLPSFVWVPMYGEYETVSIIYYQSEEETASMCDGNRIGCYSGIIRLNINNVTQSDGYGETAFGHEVLHAWGLTHGDMHRMYYCTHPLPEHVRGCEI